MRAARRSPAPVRTEARTCKSSTLRLIGNAPPCAHSGKNLQAQYERWQPRAKYKMHLDPTVEDVKKLCSTCRKSAKV